MTASIALVGDFNDQLVVAHKAIPRALEFSNSALGANITWTWINTITIQNDVEHQLKDYAGIWVVPGSPYENMDGVLNVIRYAREARKPFLGTCGGFQHALIEYARNACGIQDAEHAETNEDSTAHIVSPLSCSLVGKTGQIVFIPGSRLHSLLGDRTDLEEYHCSYGLNPKWRELLESSGMNFTGFDTSGDVRAFELPDHPFFIGALFQPERSALHDKKHPLVIAFVSAALN